MATRYLHPDAIKRCPACGIDKKHSEYGLQRHKNDDWRIRAYCKSCDNVRKILRARLVKKRLVRLMGGMCKRCGADHYHYTAYDFHHTDPNEKDFIIGGRFHITPTLLAELAKCTLVCAPCHRILHRRGLTNVDVSIVKYFLGRT